MILPRLTQKQRNMFFFLLGFAMLLLSLDIIFTKKRSSQQTKKLEESMVPNEEKLGKKSSKQELPQLPITVKQEKAPDPPAAPGGFEISEKFPMVGGIFWMDSKLCAGIENFVGASSIVDFGAGLGQYGRCFLRNYQNIIVSTEENRKILEVYFMERMKTAGLIDKPKVIKSWEGYDGAANVEHLTGNWVKFLNLAVPFGLAKRFDWVLSLEVGQNIPQEFEDIFLDNLVKHAAMGIILSWAVEGQGGYHNINNHSNDYVMGKMKERGFVHDSKASMLLRKDVSQSYFKDTIMVFRVPPKKKLRRM